MKYPYIFILTLFLGLSAFSQSSFEKSTFKEGTPDNFLAETFLALNGNHSKGNGTVIVSFSLTKEGNIESVFPEKFKVQKHAINAILAIQKTSGMWNTTKVDGHSTRQKYKIAYNFLSPNSSYELDVKMADKFASKKLYKRALKYYNKAIQSNAYEAMLYLKRAEVKGALNDFEGLKKDLLKCKSLQKEFLANVQLGVIQPKTNRQLSYINKEK